MNGGHCLPLCTVDQGQSSALSFGFLKSALMSSESGKSRLNPFGGTGCVNHFEYMALSEPSFIKPVITLSASFFQRLPHVRCAVGLQGPPSPGLP